MRSDSTTSKDGIARSGYLVGFLVVAIIGGCRTYERKPLDLARYPLSWAERVLDDPEIRRYAETIVSTDLEPGPFDVSDGLSLAEAEAIALHCNPGIRVSRANAGVPLASAEEAGWWPDPQLEMQILRFANRGKDTRFRFEGPSLDGVNTRLFGPAGLSTNGVETTPLGYRRSGGEFIEDPYVVGASLSFTIPIFGRLAVEKDLRWTEYSAAWRTILVSEWELLTRVRSLWFTWTTLSQKVAATREYVDKLSEITGMADQLTVAGELEPTEARVIRIEIASRRISLQSLENDAEQARIRLFYLMGVKPDAPVTLVPQIVVSAVDLPPGDRQARLIESHPRIRAAMADYEVAEQSLRHEIRLQYPDLQVGPSFSFEEGFSRLGLGMGFPIPIWNRNRQGIAEADAQREAVRVQAEMQVELAMSDLARAEAQLRYAVRQRQYLIHDVVPLVEQQVSDIRTLLNLGEVDVLLLRNALSSSLETKLEVLDATLAEAHASNVLSQMLRPRSVTVEATE